MRPKHLAGLAALFAIAALAPRPRPAAIAKAPLLLPPPSPGRAGRPVAKPDAPVGCHPVPSRWVLVQTAPTAEILAISDSFDRLKGEMAELAAVHRERRERRTFAWRIWPANELFA